jgi:osmotically-inducible protein OsmY
MPTLQQRAPAPLSGRNEAAKSRALEAEARAALNQSAYPAVRQVKCICRDGEVVLTGRVPSYYLKQIAQSEIRRRMADAPICNSLEVAPQEAR